MILLVVIRCRDDGGIGASAAVVTVDGRVSDTGSGLRELDRKTGTLQILIYLHEFCDATKASLTLLGHRPETIGSALVVLRNQGLIFSEKETGFPFRETFRLTILGKELLEAPLYRWPTMLLNRPA